MKPLLSIAAALALAIQRTSDINPHQRRPTPR